MPILKFAAKYLWDNDDIIMVEYHDYDNQTMIMSHQAKAEEENRVDMKNSELSATNDLSSVYRWEENKKT